jgi:hypothetical protein
MSAAAENEESEVQSYFDEDQRFRVFIHHFKPGPIKSDAFKISIDRVDICSDFRTEYSELRRKVTT